LERADLERHRYVIGPDFSQQRVNLFDQAAQRHALHTRERPRCRHLLSTAAEEAVHHIEGELLTDIDDAQLSAGVVDLADEGRARRRKRKRELAERELLDTLQPHLDLSAYTTNHPALERLHQSLVDRLQRTKALLGNAVRPAKVVHLDR